MLEPHGENDLILSIKNIALLILTMAAKGLVEIRISLQNNKLEWYWIYKMILKIISTGEMCGITFQSLRSIRTTDLHIVYFKGTFSTFTGPQSI